MLLPLLDPVSLLLCGFNDGMTLGFDKSSAFFFRGEALLFGKPLLLRGSMEVIPLRDLLQPALPEL
ncbi:MAG: hypothetical protein JNM07_13010 [Phycisphaerae bacterium]|nr:hypothetical protein [Phycisphaerae bacterium]